MVLDLIYPKKCLGCKKEGRYICTKCISSQSLTKQICPICTKASIDGFTHIKCFKKNGLDGFVSIWEYNRIIRKAISTLKYRYVESISNELAEYIVYFLGKTAYFKNLNDIVFVPIPSHKKRKNWRGFNQTETMGKQITKGLGLRYLPDVLIRKKVVEPQMKLSKKQRIRNIRGVFSFNQRYSKIGFSNSVVIFDDVWTTGSTIREAAKVIKRNLHTPVWGLTAAR